MSVRPAADGRLVVESASVELEMLPRHGARLHRLRVDGHDLLRTPPDVSSHADDPFFWGAFVMAPWCNRQTPGPVRIGSRTVALRSNFRDGSAIHGQVYDRAWQVEGDGELAIEGGGDGWPWPYRARMRVELGDRLVRLEQTLENVSDDEMPGGIGIHPWFPRPVEVAIRAGLVHPTNARAVPAEAVAGEYDRRRPADMPRDIDATWTDPGWRGSAEPAAVLRWPHLGLSAALSVVASRVYIVAASPREVDAVAVEPQTHAPFGLTRLAEGADGSLALLAPGEQLRLVTELDFASSDGEVQG